MQCQALGVNSSEELVPVHSLCNAEDVLKNERGEKKQHNIEIIIIKKNKARLEALKSDTYAEHCLVHFEL